jgi:hypothetical protein
LRNEASDLVLVSSQALQDRFGAQFLRPLSPGEIDTAAKEEPIQASDRQQFMLTVGARIRDGCPCGMLNGDCWLKRADGTTTVETLAQAGITSAGFPPPHEFMLRA